MVTSMNEWELVGERGSSAASRETERMPVPGSWLYRTTVVATSPRVVAAANLAVSLCFVPDPAAPHVGEGA